MTIAVKKAAFHSSFQTTNSVLTQLADSHAPHVYTPSILKTKEILWTF